MDQAVIKFYRKLIKEDFPNSGELENASICGGNRSAYDPLRRKRKLYATVFAGR